MYVTAAHLGRRAIRGLQNSLIVAVSLLTLNGLPTRAAEVDGPAFFASSVRPILQQNCLLCHNSNSKMSGFALDSREAALAGGTRGSAIVAGDPSKSLLLQAVSYEGDVKMPPTGKLPEDAIATLTRWIKMGAPWADESGNEALEKPVHWSFSPIVRSEPPAVRNENWSRNPIDRFVLARLEKEGVEPSPEADRITLIRRVSLDLTGIPPSPAEVDEFLADTRPAAYEHLVDRLLASPHYGERWGRYWLDLAHYADTDGYSIDSFRPIWMYRDWVIHALNADMPFNQFVTEQIAGDLLPHATQDQRVATGFLRNTMLNQEGGIDFEQYRVEAVADRVNTIGAVFLGLTIGCARCHDHKYDPISQRDYYQLFAFFNSIDELSGEFNDEEGRARFHEPVLEFGSEEEFTRRNAVRHQEKLLRDELAEYEKKHLPEWEKALTDEQKATFPPAIRELAEIPAADRNSIQQEVFERFLRERDPGYSARAAGLRALREAEPELQSSLVMRELPQPRPTHLLLGGDFLRKGERVATNTPAVLPPLEKAAEHATRLDLARWLVSPDNPLVARVTVNRVWQRYFGRGLVATENDFGTRGDPPTHPELLDWLTSEFQSAKWSMKALQRLIVTSATYRQSPNVRPELEEVDPQNRLLARQSRLRLDAEIIRDAALAASGLLHDQVGGPSVFPPQPEGAGRVTQVDRKWVAATGPDRYRRGMYTHFQRSAPYPSLAVFDAPDSVAACTRRNRSNTPLQALTLLNDEAFYEFAQALAKRVLREGPASRADRARYAFRLCLARHPSQQEQQWLLDVLDETEKEVMAAAPDPDAALLTAWTSASRVLLNLDEFMTRE